MTTTKQYDYLHRLQSIVSAPSAASAVSYSYQYNGANQRVSVTLADGSYWDISVRPTRSGDFREALLEAMARR